MFLVFYALKFTIKVTIFIIIVFLITALNFLWHAYCIMLNSLCIIIWNINFWIIFSFLFSFLLLFCFCIDANILRLVWNKAFTPLLFSCFVCSTSTYMSSSLNSSERKLWLSLVISSEKKLLLSLFIGSERKLFLLLFLPMTIGLVVILGFGILSVLHGFCTSASCLLFVQLSGSLPSAWTTFCASTFCLLFVQF